MNAPSVDPELVRLRAENERLHAWRRAVLGFLVDLQQNQPRLATIVNSGCELRETAFHERPTVSELGCIPLDDDDDEPTLGDEIHIPPSAPRVEDIGSDGDGC